MCVLLVLVLSAINLVFYSSVKLIVELTLRSGIRQAIRLEYQRAVHGILQEVECHALYQLK